MRRKRIHPLLFRRIQTNGGVEKDKRVKISKTIMLGVLAFSMVGCLSVESMKVKLNSGDPKLVAEAEQTIINAAKGCGRQDPASKKQLIVDCLSMIENNQAFYDLIDSGYGCLMDDAAKCVKLENEDDLKQAASKCWEWQLKMESGRVNEHYIDQAYKVLMERVIEKAQSPSILNVCPLPLKHGMKYRDQSNKIANRLCEIETDQLVLAELACGLNGWYPESEYKEKAFNRITEIPAKLKLLERAEYRERVLRSLSEAEIVDYIIGAVDRDTYEKELRAANASKPDMVKGKFGVGKEKETVAASKPTQVKCYRIPDGLDLIKYVNDQKMLAKIVLKAKYIPATSFSSRNYRKEAAEKLTDKKYKLALIKRLADVWAAGKRDEDTEDLLMTLATEQDGLFKWVSNLDKCKGFSYHKTMVERITDTKTADMMYDKMPMPKAEKNYEIFEALFKKLSKEKKASLVKAALERSKGVKDKIKFGEFWVGMPLVDFYALREHYGIDADYMYRETKEGVWYDRLFTTKLLFPLNSCQKFLDCEDSKILYQTIHKYVMHKEGKANVLDYMGLTKSEIETSKSSSTNWLTGQTTVDYDSTLWDTYSNSKLGTKIWFSVKAGILQFTGL